MNIKLIVMAASMAALVGCETITKTKEVPVGLDVTKLTKDGQIAHFQSSSTAACFKAMDDGFLDVMGSVVDQIKGGFSGDSDISDEAQMLREMRLSQEAALLSIENVVAHEHGRAIRQPAVVSIISAMADFCMGETNVYDAAIAQTESRWSHGKSIAKDFIWGLVAAFGIDSVSDAFVSLGAGKATSTITNIGGDGAIDSSGISKPTTTTETTTTETATDNSSRDNSSTSETPVE